MDTHPTPAPATTRPLHESPGPMSIPIAATPFSYPFVPGRTALVVIDMQRDFVEPGGFGASLGNDVSLLHSAIPPIAALLAA